MSDLVEIPQIITSSLRKLIEQLDELATPLRTLEPIPPSPRVSVAFEHLKALLGGRQNFSTKSVLKFHELIGSEGEFRKPVQSFFDENNIAIRGYHPAQAEDLEKILDDYITKYHPEQPCEQPLLKIAGAYLTFALIHPFKDGNGRVGRLIAAWLMHMHGYEILAPYLEDWMGNEDREHGKSFESDIHNYFAWCNPQNSAYLLWYVDRFFNAFLQELINGCQKLLRKT